MAAIAQVLQGHEKDIGFTVRRLLPAARQRSVGPFVFLDHMGPAHFESGTTEGDVRPHPHIGLGTVTYLFSGAMIHRDSLGFVQRIEPGAVNWMSAGRGVVHSERLPEDVRASGQAVEGIQMWIALPAALEDSEPLFRHTPAANLPVWERDGARVRLLIGEWNGAHSPVDIPSETFYATADLAAEAAIDLPDAVVERALYCVAGVVEVEGQRVEAGSLAVFEIGAHVRVSAVEAARVMLLGGAPLDGPRHIWWNFVASDRSRIERAAVDWEAGHFPNVPGETERIPAPPLNR
jgi:redox-sensitive bicupin YhaK (pirin superfamily)